MRFLKLLNDETFSISLSSPTLTLSLPLFYTLYIFSLLLTCFSAAPLFSEASTGVKSKTLKLLLCSTIISTKKKLYHSTKQKKNATTSCAAGGCKNNYSKKCYVLGCWRLNTPPVLIRVSVSIVKWKKEEFMCFHAQICFSSSRIFFILFPFATYKFSVRNRHTLGISDSCFP